MGVQLFQGSVVQIGKSFDWRHTHQDLMEQFVAPWTMTNQLEFTECFLGNPPIEEIRAITLSWPAKNNNIFWNIPEGQRISWVIMSSNESFHHLLVWNRFFQSSMCKKMHTCIYVCLYVIWICLYTYTLKKKKIWYIWFFAFFPGFHRHVTSFIFFFATCQVDKRPKIIEQIHRKIDVKQRLHNFWGWLNFPREKIAGPGPWSLVRHIFRAFLPFLNGEIWWIFLPRRCRFSWLRQVDGWIFSWGRGLRFSHVFTAMWKSPKTQAAWVSLGFWDEGISFFEVMLGHGRKKNLHERTLSFLIVNEDGFFSPGFWDLRMGGRRIMDLCFLNGRKLVLPSGQSEVH